MSKIMKRLLAPVERLKFKLSSSRLGSFFNKFSRWRRSGGSQKLDFQLPVVAPRAKFDISLTGLGLVFIAIIIALMIFGIGRVYSAISFNQAPFAGEQAQHALVGSNVNVLLIGYEESDSYYFVDFLAFIELNPTNTTQKVMVLNPDMVVKIPGVPESKLRNIMNHALLQTTTPLSYLYTAVENLIGIQIDRYLAIEKKSALELFNEFNWQHLSSDEVTDRDAGTFARNTILSDAQLMRYLAADEPGLDERALRQANFLRTKFLESLSLPSLINYGLNMDKLISSFYTDLARSELFDLVLGLTDTNFVDTMILTIRDTTYIADNAGGKYVPDPIAVDARVSRFMGRTDVIKEQARIEIFNATGVAGLANQHKRWISSLGGRVVRTGNSPEHEERSKLYVTDLGAFLKNVELIQEVMQGNVILVNSAFPLNHTGDLILVLGDDALPTQD